MPLEVLCSRCKGRLRVEKAGVVVACPLCGAHLMIPEPKPAVATVPPSAAPAPAVSMPSAAPSPVSTAAKSSPRSATRRNDDVPDFSNFGRDSADETPPWMLPGQPASVNEAPSPFPDFSAMAAPTAAAPAVAPPAVAPPAVTTPAAPSPSPPAAAVSPAASTNSAPALAPTGASPVVAPAPVASASVNESNGSSPHFFQPEATEAGASTESPAAFPWLPPSSDLQASPPVAKDEAAPAIVAASTSFTPSVAEQPVPGISPLIHVSIPAIGEAASVEPAVPAETTAAPTTPPQESPTVPSPAIPLPAEIQSESAALAEPIFASAAVTLAVAAPPAVVPPPAAPVEASAVVATAAPPAVPFVAAPPATSPPAAIDEAPDFSQFAAFAPAASPVVAAPAVVASAAAAVASTPAAAPSPATTPASPAPAAKSGRGNARKATVPQLWFVVVLSYASAVTIMLIYFIMRSQAGSPSNLESLPDVIPELSSTGQIKQKFVDQRAPMPAGHTLELGETRRFGDLKVTPVRITREALEFTHFSDPKKTRPPGEAVWKLWLRFENVSDDIAFMPLGKEIVFNRYKRPGDKYREVANNFLGPLANKSNNGPMVMVYPHVVQDVWDLKGQDIERELKPGESFETYIPSDAEGLSALSGEIVWRVHFRKGVNAKSRRGVTTLMEVVFESSEVLNRKG